MWHKKRSSPRRSQQLSRLYSRGVIAMQSCSTAEKLQQCCWIPEPRVYSNVDFAIYSRLLTIFMGFLSPPIFFQLLHEIEGFKKHTLFRKLTKTHENAPKLRLSHDRGYCIANPFSTIRIPKIQLHKFRAMLLFDTKDSKKYINIGVQPNFFEDLHGSKSTPWRCCYRRTFSTPD